MLVNKFVFMIITAIIMILLLAINIQPLLAGAITVLIVMIGYLFIAFMRGKKRLSLLDYECDPEAFLERTEKQWAITGKNPKFNKYFDIDRAAGLITLGRFEEAKEILLSIDTSKLSSKNSTLLIFTINLMICFYELGEINRAEELFETQLPVLPPIYPRVLLAVNQLVAERFFYLKRYNESREQFNKILNQKLSRRTRLEVLYYLAQIDEQDGNKEAAMVKYNQIANEGNKLWIAKMARGKCGKQNGF